MATKQPYETPRFDVVELPGDLIATSEPTPQATPEDGEL